MRNEKLLLVGVAALCAVATAGWVRPTPVTIAPQAFTAPALEPAAVLQPAPIAASMSQANRGVYHQASSVSQRAPSVRRARNVYDDRREVYDDRPVQQTRSTGKSVAIIGGSAAAGAAIGGLAGGGKGAAIGAVTGGAVGLVYDRMTRNKSADDDSIYKSERSTGKSAMIIGGGAAAGAAIGAAAGGGKGAAIGALGGGAAGLIYDRMTKNR